MTQSDNAQRLGPDRRGVEPTAALIELLASSATSVRPLGSPWVQTLGWTAGAFLTLGVAALLLDGTQHLAHFLATDQPVQTVAAAISAVLSALACCLLSRPDRSGRWMLLPALGLGGWFLSLGLGVAGEMRADPEAAMALQTSWGCARFIGLGGSAASFVLLWTNRVGLLLRPREVVLSAALAGSTAAASVVGCTHSLETVLMVAAWHVGSVAVVSGLLVLLHQPIARGLVAVPA